VHSSRKSYSKETNPRVIVHNAILGLTESETVAAYSTALARVGPTPIKPTGTVRDVIRTPDNI